MRGTLVKMWTIYLKMCQPCVKHVIETSGSATIFQEVAGYSAGLLRTRYIHIVLPST